MQEPETPSLSKAYQIVTDRIIDLLGQGIVPWRKPWRGGGGVLPQSLASGRPYRGVNVFLLTTAASVHGYTSPYWLTFKQARERGGHVRKGEKSTPVVFWKLLDARRRGAESEDDGDDAPPEEGTAGAKKIPFLRFFSAFNVEQCDGIAYPKPDLAENPFDPIAQCQMIVEAMPNPPAIRHEEPRAYYRPSADLVNMPKPGLFESSEEYFSTLFHELVHSTGHKSRLDRKSIVELTPFGSESYAKEELIAEMGAAFLCWRGGIDPATLANSAAYIHGWIAKLKSDPKIVVLAAASAQKAADYISDGDRNVVGDEAVTTAAARTIERERE